ncbi:GAF domain-containing protein [Roseimicrobium gellanilyticum]|uniref:GAF domain-containing protein n=1 Tax=Roseimicrobium gellanilyticum TaxID=748857 RepID=A0A366H4R1_9BACT|nr:LytTR family transcriptional regulator DNA-binding domain-containing protein [Roseimicrobium gellanilyticum]RBP36321.1 GAF domain-containing protein [Roseimicrobium gellanilyticum]
MKSLSPNGSPKYSPEIASKRAAKPKSESSTEEHSVWKLLAMAATAANPITALNSSLAILGPLYRADRAWLGRYNEGLTHFWGVSDWVAPGVISHVHEMQGVSVDVIVDAHRKFLRRERVEIPDVERLPRQSRSLQAELRREGVRSTLSAGLVRDGTLIGFFGFDHVRELAAWTAADLDRISALGDFLAALLHRSLSEAPPADLPSTTPGSIFVTERNGLRALSIEEVFFIKADGDYSHVQLGNGQSYYERRSLRTWIAQLPRERFLRVHQSYLVNGNRIAQLERGANWTLTLQEVPEPIPVGRAYRHAVRLHLGF